MIRKAWCPTCRLNDYVDARWRCRWCGELTLKSMGRAGAPRFVTVPVIREAHRLHAEGATLAEAADAVVSRTEYANAYNLRCKLPTAFASLGLPYRSISDAQRLRAFRNPAPKRPDVTTAMALAAVARHWTLEAAARSLGITRVTLDRRLRQGEVERVRAAGL